MPLSAFHAASYSMFFTDSLIDCHVGEFFLNQLETTNSLAKLHALIGVARRIFKGAHRRTVVGEGYQETFMVELSLTRLKPLPSRPNMSFSSSSTSSKVISQQLSNNQTELFKFGHFDARFAHINKPFGVDRFVRRSPVARHHHDVRGIGAAGNKTLTTIKINLTISDGYKSFSGYPRRSPRPVR